MDTVIQGGAELQPAGRNSEPSAAFLEKTERAQEDLLKIIEYLAQRRALRQDDKVAKQEIEAAANLCARPVAAMSDEDRQRVWSTFDALSHRIAPATVEGLREYEDHRALPPRFRWCLCALLIATILIQTYAFSGIQLLNAIDARSKEQAALHQQINSMQEANPDLINLRVSHNGDLIPEVRSINIRYSHLLDNNMAVNRQKKEYYVSLYQWNSLWAAPLAFLISEPAKEYWGCECLVGGERCSWQCPPGKQQVTYGSESIARALVLDLQILVLPVLYSALGAGVWIVRNHLAQVAERRQRAAQPGEIGQRILLAAVLGGLVGALYMSDEIKSQLGSLPLLGLAFIVGYNVEMVFSVLDRAIASIRHKGAPANG